MRKQTPSHSLLPASLEPAGLRCASDQDGDLDVPLQQATALVEDLRSHNIEHDVIMIPNEIHAMARYASWMTLFHATDVYFNRHLDKRIAQAP